MIVEVKLYDDDHKLVRTLTAATERVEFQEVRAKTASFDWPHDNVVRLPDEIIGLEFRLIGLLRDDLGVMYKVMDEIYPHENQEASGD